MDLLQNTVFIEIDHRHYMGISKSLMEKLFKIVPEPSVAALFYSTYELKEIYLNYPLPSAYVDFAFIEMATIEGYAETVDSIRLALSPKLKLIKTYGV